jgi:hypothetical protein
LTWSSGMTSRGSRRSGMNLSLLLLLILVDEWWFIRYNSCWCLHVTFWVCLAMVVS